MNFYIGMSIENLDFNDYNVRIDEDLYEEYLYKMGFEYKLINKIDPYGDTILLKDNIALLINDCDMVLNSENKINKEFIDEIKKLKQLCQKALFDNKNIICIGD